MSLHIDLIQGVSSEQNDSSPLSDDDITYESSKLSLVFGSTFHEDLGQNVLRKANIQISQQFYKTVLKYLRRQRPSRLKPLCLLFLGVRLKSGYFDFEIKI